MRLIIMFIAIALSAGAFFITMHFTSSPPPANQPPVVEDRTTIIQKEPTVDIYTAKQDIPIGTVVTQEMLDLRPWPKNLILPDMNLVDPSKPSEAVNMIARTPFQKGEPIIMNRLANANDPSFLAASLMPGMRLITLAVDTISGGGGFIYPGDRVDVLITHDVPSDIRYETTTAGITQKTINKEATTEILIGNIRVMATNQKSTAHGGDAPVPPTDISLEVSSEDAQKIRLAENGNGRLSLVLRALKDTGEQPRPVPPTEVSTLSAVRQLPAPDDNAVLVVRNVKTQSVGITTP